MRPNNIFYSNSSPDSFLFKALEISKDVLHFRIRKFINLHLKYNQLRSRTTRIKTEEQEEEENEEGEI